MARPFETDFDEWLTTIFERAGSFTMLLVLVKFEETAIAILRSSHLHVIGDEIGWQDMLTLLAKANVTWDCVALYQAGREGLVEDGVARERLASLIDHLDEDRTLLNEAGLFNRDGLSVRIDEIARH